MLSISVGLAVSPLIIFFNEPVCVDAIVMEKVIKAIKLPKAPSPERNHAPLPQQFASTMPTPKMSPPSKVARTGSCDVGIVIKPNSASAKKPMDWMLIAIKSAVRKRRLFC